MAIKTYKLIKDFPQHKIGELIYKPHDDSKHYEWQIGNRYLLDADMVEENPDYFEELILNWERNEPIYFLSLSGEIVEEEFDPKRHSEIARFGNAFKSNDDATWFLNQIKKLLNSEKSSVISKDDILPILSALQKKNIGAVKKLLEEYI